MKQINGYSKNIKVNGKTYTVTITAKGKGLKTVYYGSVSNGIISLEMSGFPVDQRQAKTDPKVYTPDEIMDLAIWEAKNWFIPDLNTIDRFYEKFIDITSETLYENTNIQN